ncbi:hypothetical protein [Pendulispora albinea]|uniref:DUF6292 family protein n=1 Tax=Pendulispora albinea TaxID=2741071 RepID=A0ABZ2LPN6_9BACT
MIVLPIRNPLTVSFSPDESEIAVWTSARESGGERTKAAIDIYSVRDGSRVHSIPAPKGMGEAVVHLGDSIVSLTMTDAGTPERPRRWKVVRWRRPDFVPETVHIFRGVHWLSMAPLGDGFVVSPNAPDSVHPPGTFLFGGNDGPLREQIFGACQTRLLATDRTSGRIAIVTHKLDRSYLQDELLVLDSQLAVLGRTKIASNAEIHWGWFCGKDRLVTYGQWQVLRSRRLREGELVVSSDRHLNKHEHDYARNGGRPVIVPALDLIGVERDGKKPIWANARTLDDVDRPNIFAKGFPLWVSAKHAVLCEHDVEIVELLRKRARREKLELAPPRTDHVPYIRTVARELKRLGVGAALGGMNQKVGEAAPRGSSVKVLQRIGLINVAASSIAAEFEDNEGVYLEWDEEIGWNLVLATFLGETRPYAYSRHYVDLGLVPEPGEIASRVRAMLERPKRVRKLPTSERARRSFSKHDPELEAALATYALE